MTCRHESDDELRAVMALRSGNWPALRHIPAGYRDYLHHPPTAKGSATLAVLYLAPLFLLRCWQPGVAYGWHLGGAAVIWLALVTVQAALVGWHIEIEADTALHCGCVTGASTP